MPIRGGGESVARANHGNHEHGAQTPINATAAPLSAGVRGAPGTASTSDARHSETCRLRGRRWRTT